MISQNSVLTASSLALNKVPEGVEVSDKVADVVMKLSTEALSMEGYTLDNVATLLPKNTGGDSSYDVLADALADRMGPFIRQSLTGISTYITPVCQLLEGIVRRRRTEEDVFEHIYDLMDPDYVVIDKEFLNGLLFNVSETNMFLSGTTSFGAPDDTKKVCEPEFVHDDVIKLVGPAVNIPEVKEIFADERVVCSAWRGVFTGMGRAWEFRDMFSDKAMSLNNLKFDSRGMKVTIAALVIAEALHAKEEPYPGVKGLSLEEYNGQIGLTRQFLSAVLNRLKKQLTGLANEGIVISLADLKVKDGFMEGKVGCVLTKEVQNYFSDSLEYSLSEFLIGLAVIRSGIESLMITGPVVNQVADIIAVGKRYTSRLTDKINQGHQKYIAERVHDAIIETSKLDCWKEYLVDVDGLNGPEKLRKILDNCIANDSLIGYLTTPSVFRAISKDELGLANTMFAVNLAKALGMEVAAEVLEEGIDLPVSSPEEQRVALTRSIITCVVKRLFK